MIYNITFALVFNVNNVDQTTSAGFVPIFVFPLLIKMHQPSDGRKLLHVK